MCRIRAGGGCVRVGGTVWNTLKKQERGSTAFKKEWQVSSRDGCLKKGGGLEPPCELCTNTWNWNVDSLVTVLITRYLHSWDFPIFENCFQYQMGYFFSKEVDLFKFRDLQVFNWVGEKVKNVFRIFCRLFFVTNLH